LWYGRNSEAVGLVFFALALILISTFLLFRKNMKNVLTSKMFYLGLASLSSFLYILFTAPDLRFGGIFIWIFFACSVGAYLSNLNWNNNFRLLFSFLFLIFIFKFVWPIRLDTEPYLKSIRWDQASPTENVNGILMPTEDGCGNSDLPCTPESNNIKWRVPGDLSKGFAPIK
jgi:hypothetical protein